MIQNLQCASRFITVGFTLSTTSCGSKPSRNINPITGTIANRSPPCMSGKLAYFSGTGPVNTFWITVRITAAVTSKPRTETVAATHASGKTPRKIRNSPTNPFSPGSPSDENSTIPISPAITGAGLRNPPKSSMPRCPPVRSWIIATTQNSAAGILHHILHACPSRVVVRHLDVLHGGQVDHVELVSLRVDTARFYVILQRFRYAGNQEL